MYSRARYSQKCILMGVSIIDYVSSNRSVTQPLVAIRSFDLEFLVSFPATVTSTSLTAIVIIILKVSNARMSLWSS